MTAAERAKHDHYWDVEPCKRDKMNPTGVAFSLEVRRMNQEAQRNREGLRRLQEQLRGDG